MEARGPNEVRVNGFQDSQCQRAGVRADFIRSATAHKEHLNARARRFITTLREKFPVLFCDTQSEIFFVWARNNSGPVMFASIGEFGDGVDGPCNGIDVPR